MLPRASLPLKRKRSSIKPKRQTTIHYRHLSKESLGQRYKELIQYGRCFLERYADLTNRYSVLQENNRILATRNAELLHENETLRSQIERLNKDQSVKIIAARKEYQELVEKIQSMVRMCSSTIENEIHGHDPLRLLDQIYEKSLSFEDVSHLDNLNSTRINFNMTLEEKQQLREQSKERVNERYGLHINLSNIAEETTTPSEKSTPAPQQPSPISSSPSKRQNESILNVKDGTPHNSTLTPSFRRFIPKTPEQPPGSLEYSTSGSESDWQYNSELYVNPLPENVPSTTLDSIQSFEPKTPSLGIPPLSSSTCSRPCSKIRQSAVYPEKTPEKSNDLNEKEQSTSCNAGRGRGRGKSKRLLNERESTLNEESLSEANSTLRRSTRLRKKVCY